MGLFAELYRTSVVPSLMEVFAEAERWRYHETYGTGDPVEVVVHAGNIETRSEETLEREKKVRQRILMLTADPDNEDYPGLANVSQNGVFESPADEDGKTQLWSVVDDETHTRSGSLLRVRVQFARWTKLDGYGER